MPQMDGVELLKRIRGPRRETASVPAIACTAFGSKEDVVRTQSAGFQAHVTKPTDPGLLVATIVDLIHSSSETEAT